MSNLESLELELRDKLTIKKEVDQRIIELKQAIADERCPFRVGEKVFNKRYNESAIVAVIFYKSYSCGYGLKVFKIKKNGEPYKEACHAYNEEEYVKE